MPYFHIASGCSRMIEEEKSTSAELETGKGLVRQRKYSVYHKWAESRSGRYCENGVSGRGYDYLRRSSTSTDDYRRKSASDDYKRKVNEEIERNKELKFENNGFSVKCYVYSLIFTTLTIVGLFITLYYIFVIPYPPDVKITSQIYSRETKRRVYTLMSDSLDCSLYMKRLTMQSMDVQHVMVHGLACLSVIAPHSVAPDSGLSMLIFSQQGKKHLTFDFEKTMFHTTCTYSNLSNCSLSDFPLSLRSTSYLNGQFVDSNIKAAWLAKPMNISKHSKVWSRIEEENSLNSPLMFRRFRISILLDKALIAQGRQFNKLPLWLKRMNFNSTDEINTSNDLTVNSMVAHHTTDEFFRIRNIQEVFGTDSPISYSVIQNANIYLIFPSGRTSSLFSAFIIQVVHAILKNREMDGSSDEVDMYGYMLKAQRLAYFYFSKSKEWNKNSTSERSLLHHTTISEAVRLLKSGMSENIVKVRRNIPDRVATIVSWKNVDDLETIIMLNVGLPNLFESTHIHGNVRKPFSSFEVDGNVSDPITSAAGLLVAFKKYLHGSNTSLMSVRPLMIASASGSVRTVEAVSSVLLRMFFFDEDPGKAIHSPAAFWDVRDGNFYCESDTDDARILFDEVQKKHGIECHEIPPDDFAANDRIAMAARRNFKQKKTIKAAVDRRAFDFNYAVGY